MIDVVIDTSIYRADPRRKKPAFRAVERLAKAGKLRIHLPYFVQHEFITHMQDEYAKPLREIRKLLGDTDRKIAVLGIRAKSLPKKHQIKKLLERVEAAAERDFKSWAKAVNAKPHSIRNHHGKQIAKDYFKGHAPFSGKKARNDIPDSFRGCVRLS